MRPCSEFPNDNPALHEGAIWSCLSACAPATCVRSTELRANRARVEPPRALADASETPDTPAADAFRTLVSVVRDVARAQTGNDELAAAIDWTFDLSDTAFEGLPESSSSALAAAGCVETSPRGVVRSERHARTVAAWRRILRAESEDFDPCASATLDEWAADLLARLLGRPEGSVRLRRELRARGVAAFGLATAPIG